MGQVTLLHRHSWPDVQRGGERYLHDIAWYLRRQTDLAPTIVTGVGRPRHDQVEQTPVHRTWRLAPPDLGRLHARLPRSTVAWAGVTGRLALRATEGQVTHAFSPAAVRAAVGAGHRTVFTTMGVRDRAYIRQHPRRWAPVAEAAAAADVVTAFGNDAAEGLADALGRDVIALQPGIRLAEFPLEHQPRTDCPTILFASYLNQKIKGFRAVLEALPAVVRTYPDARLVVAGPGQLQPFLESASPAVASIRDHVVRIHPRPGEMAALYARASVTVLASTREAFGLVLAESLACGTPIVASNEGGPAEIINGGIGRVGYDTPPHDPEGIAAALVASIGLAQDPATPRHCRDHATQWGWVEHVGPRHEQIYRGLGA